MKPNVRTVFWASTLCRKHLRAEAQESLYRASPVDKKASDTASKVIMAFYTKIHDEHWLRDKLEDGRIIILEDESMWEIHPSDRQRTKRWLRISTVMVKYTQKADYPYLLSNSTEGEDAWANYLSDSALTAPGVA